MNKTISNALIVRIAVFGITLAASMFGISCFIFRTKMTEIHATPAAWTASIAIASVAYLASFLPMFSLDQPEERGSYLSYLIGGGIAFSTAIVFTFVLLAWTASH